MFCFTSIDEKIQSNSSGGGGNPPQFILSRQNFNIIGSLILEEGVAPNFAELYIYDTMNEISNIFNHFKYKSYLIHYIILILLFITLCDN